MFEESLRSPDITMITSTRRGCRFDEDVELKQKQNMISFHLYHADILRLAEMDNRFMLSLL